VKPFNCNECERRFTTEAGRDQHKRDSHGAEMPQICERSPRCIECGKEAELVYGDVIYPHRADLFSKRFWLCECGAYCGCHGVTSRPLGNPCGRETRIARMAAHDLFDPIWRSREMDRRGAYTWLAERMGLQPEQCHIGMMTEKQAREVVLHCRERSRVAA
jgi:hypothetical protein